jgi:CRP-like cAMP-binding protein
MNKTPLGPPEIRHLSATLRNLSFFEGMSMGGLERLIDVTNVYEYRSGEVVFKKGQVGDALYVVHTGAVNVFIKKNFFLPAKKISTLGSGEIFGEMALLDQPYRTATVIASGPTKLFVIFISNFNQLFDDNPDFARRIRQMAKERSFEQR